MSGTSNACLTRRMHDTQKTTQANTVLMVHHYTKLTLPVKVRGGSVLRWTTPSSLRRTRHDGVAMGLPIEQQSHCGLRRETSILYNGIQLTPYLCAYMYFPVIVSPYASALRVGEGSMVL